MSEKSINAAMEDHKASYEYIREVEMDASLSNEDKMVALLADMARGMAGLKFSLALIHDSIDLIQDTVMDR